jgi:uncharacterized protein YndB with AHSA1/START domain
METTGKQVSAIRVPDLSARPFDLTVERILTAAPAVLYRAWTQGFDQWFAAPGSVLMRPEVNAVFFFETEYKEESEPVARRHPHYGRFLKLVENQLIELTWVTGTPGTEGAETVVTVELRPQAAGTAVHLTHAGFASAAARDRHREAWPWVLEQLDKSLNRQPDRSPRD